MSAQRPHECANHKLIFIPQQLNLHGLRELSEMPCNSTSLALVFPFWKNVVRYIFGTEIYWEQKVHFVARVPKCSWEQLLNLSIFKCFSKTSSFPPWPTAVKLENKQCLYYVFFFYQSEKAHVKNMGWRVQKKSSGEKMNQCQSVGCWSLILKELKAKANKHLANRRVQWQRSRHSDL